MKQNMPNIPGMEAMTDTLEFVKNLWGNMGIPGMGGGEGMKMPGMPGMNIPGMVMPTLSVEEINKKITDLKAVESWLSLNMGMLRSTIQALEVQAATIGALQTMGETFSSTMQAGFNAMPSNGAGGTPNGAANGAAGSTAGEARQDAPEAGGRDQIDAAALAAPLVNAAAWWNMLQEQFKQAVRSAVVEANSAAEDVAAKPAAKSPEQSKPDAAPAKPRRKPAK